MSAGSGALAGELAAAAGHLAARRYGAAEAAAGPLAATGDATALHVLAEARLGQGLLDEAAQDFDAALGRAPFQPRLWTARADLELWRAGLPGWEAVVDRGLARPVLPPHAFHLWVRKAALCWMRRDGAACGAILDHLAGELTRQGAALAEALRGYTMSTAIHLRGLMSAQAAGRGGQYAQAELPPVFLLGDSHCIGPAGSVTGVAGRPHRVVPLYVLGLKAWHLVAPGGNPYRAGAERRVADIPAGAAVIVTAGDIDCRPHSGFDNLRRRGHADVAGAVRATASAYVDWVAAQGWAQGGAPAFVLGPPAQRMEGVAVAERAAVGAIGAGFRAALREACGRRGLGYLDYGALTLRVDGSIDPALYVDGQHLSGAALGMALARV